MKYDSTTPPIRRYSFGLNQGGTVDVRAFGTFPVLAPPSQLFVPVTARGTTILDNGGDPVAECFTPELAQRIADLLNGDAREFMAAT